MKIPEATVVLLREYARRPLVRSVHPEDREVYNQGLTDGTTITAQEILDVLNPEEEPAQESE
jgi:hypothetical protein